MDKNNQYNSAFISDVHLGFLGCKAEQLNEFLNELNCKKLFLVGDIIDFWAMKENFYWPKEHQKVLDKLKEMQDSGTDVLYITGNHDDPLRSQEDADKFIKSDKRFKKIIDKANAFKVVDSHIHQSKVQGKILIIHGDQFDVVTSNIKWLSKFGGVLYEILLKFNRPLSKKLKSLTKKTVNKASNFQMNVQRLCRKEGYKGLLCGHTHLPQIKQNIDYVYFNTGDWIEACTAITEDLEGSFELKSFTNKKPALINKL
jgi:UDP-2,3-diacylglucosamine pyrophosphatase LpxH